MSEPQLNELLDIARRHLQAGRLADVEQTCRSLVALMPGAQEPRRLWALAAYFRGDLTTARHLLEEAIACGPPSADCLDNLSIVLLAQGLAAEAEQAARQALAADVTYSEAWNNLGNALQTLGRPAEARDAYRQALTLRPGSVAAEKNLADVHLQLGQWDEAEAASRRALALRPDQPGALVALGIALGRQSRWDEAERVLRRAVEVGGPLPMTMGHLALTLAALDRRAEADQTIAQSLCVSRVPPMQFCRLADLLMERQWHASALAVFRHVLTLQADQPEALIGVCHALRELGRREEAEAACRRALELTPRSAGAYVMCGVLLQDQCRNRQAEAAYRRALELSPHHVQAMANLASALIAQSRLDEAVAVARQAIAVAPRAIDGHVNLGAALSVAGRLTEAREVLESALQLAPQSSDLHLNLAMVWQTVGCFDEAQAHFRLARGGRNAERVESNAIACYQYRPGVTVAELAELHAEWDRRLAAPLRAEWKPWSNSRVAERPLRVGFVSANFSGHPVGYFLVGVLEAFDRRRFQLFCYNQTVGPDAMTDRIRRAVDTWRDVFQHTDAELAALVRADAIDVLVDLAGHTEGNRLLMFARKPAPIQVSWIGYPGTTGVGAIDYLVADRQQVPAADEPFYREHVLCLEGGYVAYTAPAEAGAVGPLPARGNGWPTFGCFSNAMKLNEQLIGRWGEILRRLPESRLLLKYGRLDDPLIENRLREQFAVQGIDRQRVEILGHTDRAEHLAAYGRVDVALDTFPYSGGVTTCEALWMGVPVIAWPGATFAGRHSLSHLTAAGLAELVARDADHYVELAVEWATNLERLEVLRAGLRQRVADSPLCDARRVAEQLSGHLIEAWRRFCDQSPQSSGVSS